MVNVLIVNLSLTAILLLAVFLVPRLKRFRWPLVWLCLVQMGFHTLLVFRMLGLKELKPLLVGLAFPTKILQLILLLRFIETFSVPDKEIRRLPLVYGVALFFSVAWYLALQVWLPVLPADIEYGLARHPLNLIRYLVLSVVLILAVVQSHEATLRLAKRAEAHFSNIKSLRLPVLKGIVAYYFLAYLLSILDFVTGPRIALYHWQPVLFTVGVAGLMVYIVKESAVFAIDFPEENQRERQLAADEAQRIQIKLEKSLRVDRIYLNPDLRLIDLASAIGEKPYKVTAVLNQLLGQSFNEYVNRFRIEHAKELLGRNGSAPDSPSAASHLNLMGVAMESGFNSKSVFNDCFKKVTGMTPSGYRSAQIRPEP